MIPLTWHHDYPGSERQVAKLGEIAIGAVITGRSSKPSLPWSFITWLPSKTGSGFPMWQDVKSESAAKLAVTGTVTTWLASAGVLSLAERDRADAATLPLFAEPAK